MKLISIFATALLSFAGIAQAGLGRQDVLHFANNEGEYLVVESRQTPESQQAFPAVIAAIKKAGYHHVTGQVQPGTKTDTWCKVDVYMQRQIIGECYTPQMGHGLSVRNHVTTVTDDYSQVPTMIVQLRDEYRRASAVLGIKS